jgi:3-dehydroquinate dehydratase-2
MEKQDDRPHILIIHGPNLNMLGKREPEIYGNTTLEEINASLLQLGNQAGLSLETFQSNHEGEIVSRIQEAAGVCDGLIINPGAYTHTSIAIRDAVLMLDCPIIEIHLSNIYKRESFRHQSMLADIVTAQLTGFGVQGYSMALEAIIKMTGS